MNHVIPYGKQTIDQHDIDSVVSVLRSDFLTQGPVVPRFEELVASYCNVRHTVATNSATSALHIACLSLGLGPGDRLWTSPVTFVASANCALYCGATVDFVDIDSRTYNLSPERLADKLALAAQAGTLPKIVVPVHFCGQSCDMAAIHELSLRYGFRIIEDASHAIGGRYRDESVGSCRYSDIAVFSFHPVKIITTAEGGMALTNDPELARLMQSYRSHGITTDPGLMHSRPADEIWNYQQISLGFNYRMTDVHAALGVSQMRHLDEFVQQRHRIAQCYDEAFANFPVRTPWQSPESYSSYHLYPLRLDRSLSRPTQREVYDYLRNAGILVNLHYIPVYRQPWYEKLGFESGYCPESESYFRETLTLPMYPALTDAEQLRVIEAVSGVFA